MSNRANAEAAGVDDKTVGKVRDSLEVQSTAPGGDQGGVVVGKDGKAYLSKKGSNGQGRCQGN